jgi:hypothetical protein
VEKRWPHRLRENRNVPSVRAFCPLGFSDWVASVGPALTVGKLFADAMRRQSIAFASSWLKTHPAPLEIQERTTDPGQSFRIAPEERGRITSIK